MRVAASPDVARLVAVRTSPARVAIVHQLVADAGLVLRGHFQLPSGVHAGYFLRGRGMGARPDLLDLLARELVDILPFEMDGAVIVCPESAGFFLGDAIARLQGLDRVVIKTDVHGRPTPELRAGKIGAGQPVVLINDVATSGTSLRLLHEIAAAHGAHVRGIAVLATIGRGPLRMLNQLGVEGAWLIEAQWPLYPADACALCAEGRPLVLTTELS